MPQPFRVSTGLKDLIGRDLITNDFVAVFELVKNAFDAHAKTVKLIFESDRMAIADDGKGMSAEDIQNKWLFVAYSAKRDGTEDHDYRADISKRSHPYAGAKGVGRFSCDRLGKTLRLSSRAIGKPVQVLEIDWTLYEADAKKEIADISLEVNETDAFPEIGFQPLPHTGTVLEIRGLRSKWDRKKFLTLKRELAKLINPFSTDKSGFEIELIVPAELNQDQVETLRNENTPRTDVPPFTVNGVIENTILDVLKQRTTSITIDIADGTLLETLLKDRGDQIYRIREPNPYKKLKDANLEAEVFFLNRSAKAVFRRRMGLPSVQFGSIFLFRNGFRVFPIGQEHDDFFGLTRRKQQGMRRFLGSRDLIGRVDVKGVAGFSEATSRDQGLIMTQEVEELIDCIQKKVVHRLERYVVDITWKDSFDKDQADTSRMKLDHSVARITQLVSKLADTKGVEIISYNPDLVKIVDERSQKFESSLQHLEILAERTGNNRLLAQIIQAKRKMKEIQAAERKAQSARRRAEKRASRAEKTAESIGEKYVQERDRNQFLVSAASLDHDTILNLHHQIVMHASDVHHEIRRTMDHLRRAPTLKSKEWVDFLEKISFRNSQILTASRFATKSGYRQQAASIVADLPIYIHDYIVTIASLWAPRGVTVDVITDGKKMERSFRPIDVGIVIDNLISNAAKSKATKIGFLINVGNTPRPYLSMIVADDGSGWPPSADPLDRIFEKGVTTTDGSGLGLFHVKQVVERLGGSVHPSRDPYSNEFGGAMLTIRVPS